MIVNTNHALKKHPKIRRSYGIACCRFNAVARQYEVLMVRRRTTYAFMDFVLGVYDKRSNAAIIALLDAMTIQEKLDIMSMRFDIIWWRMWLTFPEGATGISEDANDDSWLAVYKRRTIWDFIRSPPPRTKQELYIIKKTFFEATFLCDKGVRLRHLMGKSLKSIELTWEMPKGGSKPGESAIDCACREFSEETAVGADAHSIVYNVAPVVHSFTDGPTTFCETYYLAIATADIVPRISIATSMQLIEIDSIKWISLAELHFMQHNHVTKVVATLFRMMRAENKRVKPTTDTELYLAS